MKIWDHNTDVFIGLVRAGLFARQDVVSVKDSGMVDWDEVLRLAVEQRVEGLVAAGMDNCRIDVPQAVKLQFVGRALMTEQRNREMGMFTERLCGWLREAGVVFVVVKGQGVAQCYDRPQWRACGDVDLLLDAENYDKAKRLLQPMARRVDKERTMAMHQSMNIDGIEVELHGRMPYDMSKRADRVADEVVRVACAGGATVGDVPIPGPDEHVYLVFSHMLHHFFIEGVGLRQVCDWCRILWTYRDILNKELLAERICRAGLQEEWRVFGAMAVQYLGMSVEALPTVGEGNVSGRRMAGVLYRVIRCGNFGHNKDLSYRSRYGGWVYKTVALWRRLWDFASQVSIFPKDAPRFFMTYVIGKARELD